MKKTILLLSCFLSILLGKAQVRDTGSTSPGRPANVNQNLFFVKKGTDPVFSEKDYIPSKQGFYIYRNCIYQLVLKTKLEVAAKVVDIRNDSIYYTLYINQAVAESQKVSLDTFALHPYQIRRIKLIGDRLMGLYGNIYLSGYSFKFENASKAKEFTRRTDTAFAKDSSYSRIFEVVPYLTQQGLDQLYEQCGTTYYYRGPTDPVCEDTSAKEFVIKKIIWFTPSNANEIRGLSVGLLTFPLDEGPLNIRGVNLNADILSIVMGPFAVLNIPFNNALINMPDTVDTSGITTRIRGVSISAGGVIGDNEIKGISINGIIHSASVANGLTITGTQNTIEAFNGVVVGGLRNRSIKGKGVQVGLLNICKNLKGIQIGLWNVNSKRKLPFINWSF